MRAARAAEPSYPSSHDELGAAAAVGDIVVGWGAKDQPSPQAIAERSPKLSHGPSFPPGLIRDNVIRQANILEDGSNK